MNKVLIILYLISTIFCADTCSTKTETDCKVDSTCKWTPSSFSEESGNICSELTEEESCEEEEYDGTETTCTYTQTTPGSCGGTRSGCDAQNSDSSAWNALPGCSHDDTLCVSECSTLSQNDCKLLDVLTLLLVEPVVGMEEVFVVLIIVMGVLGCTNLYS